MTETGETALAETLIEVEAWRDARLPDLAEHAVRAVLGHLQLPNAGFAISVLGCDDDRIAALNAEFRDRRGPTNVLSWPSEARLPEVAPRPGTKEMPEELGDIAIAYETCSAEAVAQGKTLEHHTMHLLVHGILHLFGYDHEEDDAAALMEAAETTILGKLGIADPYA